MKAWGLVHWNSATVPFSVTFWVWSNMANEWCACAAAIRPAHSAAPIKAFNFISPPSTGLCDDCCIIQGTGPITGFACGGNENEEPFGVVYRHRAVGLVPDGTGRGGSSPQGAGCRLAEGVLRSTRQAARLGRGLGAWPRAPRAGGPCTGTAEVQ